MHLRERTARSDIEKWSQIVRNDVAEFLAIADYDLLLVDRRGPLTGEQRLLNVRLEQMIDRIWGDAAQWYKAVDRRALPREARKIIADVLDIKLRDTVRCVRNLREHWDTERRYFAEDEFALAPPQHKSVNWYRENYPGQNPWTWQWNISSGYLLGGALDPGKLLSQVDKIDSILA